jgi:hypothetical protein
MALAQPVRLSEPAWRAIREGVIAPARSRGAAASPEVARLADAWDAGRPEAGQVTVWLDADLAQALAGLLDERPELAAHLGGEPG